MDKINSRLDEYIESGKRVVVCLSDRYKVNKVIDDLGRDDFVFTDLDNIFDNFCIGK